MAALSVGIQLYTVRDALQADFDGTIKNLAALGYEGVEFAWNYGGKSPEELAAFLKECGLKACGLHAPLDGLLTAGSEPYQYAKALGCKYVTTSLAQEVAKDWKKTIQDVAACAKVAADEGLVFTYHNHAQEFELVDGQCALDMLYEQTDADTVKAELDTFWIKKGGDDPVSYIRKYAGRVPQIHMKDMNPETNDFTPVGTGLMDVPAICALGVEIGAEWIIYEQDVCQGDAMECARTSIENIKKAMA